MCKFQKDWMNNKKGQNFQRPPNKVFDCRFSIKTKNEKGYTKSVPRKSAFF